MEWLMINKIKNILSGGFDDFSFLIDENYYRSTYKINAQNVFQHFIKKGFNNNFNPSPLIDIGFIKKHYGSKTFADFIEIISNNKSKLSNFFDPNFYFEVNPDVANSGELAIHHFMTFGIEEQRKFHSDEDIDYEVLKNNTFSERLYIKKKVKSPIEKIPLFKDEWDNSYIEHHYFKAKSIDTNIKFRPNSVVKNVLIIGEMNLIQCKKYRILQKLEFFNSQQINYNFSHWLDVPRSTNLLQSATSVIFYRVPLTKITNSYFNEAKRLKLHVGYDIDDPIFDIPTYANNINLDYLDINEKLGILSTASAYESMIRMCDYVITSTPALESKISNITDKDIFLWRNAVDSESLNVLNYLKEFRKSSEAKTSKFRIVYMSGSRAHEADFETAIHSINKVLRENKNVEVIIHGHAKMAIVLKNKYEDRITIKKFSNYYSYLESFIGADLNIIPLVKDEFNDCKSAIRYLEASLFSVPTLVTHVGDFRNIINDKKDGFFVRENDEWYTLINFAINNPEEMKKIGLSANKNTLDNYKLKTIGESISKELFKYL